ncbi:MAG: endonuclease/exonuclease/phosphatase family protein [Terracoccus sp.]
MGGTTRLTVATANTCSGGLLRATDGLAPFADAGADVIGLQEVFGLGVDEVEQALAASGYVLTGHHLAAGLAIAHHPTRLLALGAARPTTLKSAGPLLRVSNHWHERGLLRARFEIGGRTFTFATAHLIVFARAVARSRQVAALGRALAEDGPAEPLVVTGDMNHYPGPGRRDRTMHDAAGLTAAVLPGPTWRVAGSPHEWLARAGSRASGRALERFDGELDAVLHRDLALVDTTLLEIASDHRGVVCRFELPD